MDVPRTVIFSDASSFAIEAIFENESGRHTCHKNLTTKERLKSSTWRELLAIDYTLKCFAPLLENTSIHVKTDNFATLVITRKGSNKTSLQKFAENINKICVENSIKFEISWIPRNNNAAADAISKLTDYDDWQTTLELFQKISEIWEKFTIDNLQTMKTQKQKNSILSTGVQVHLMLMHLPFHGQAKTII